MLLTKLKIMTAVLLAVVGVGFGGLLCLARTGERAEAVGRSPRDSAKDKQQPAADGKDNKPVWTLARKKDVRAVAYAVDGQSVVAGDEAGAVKLWAVGK